MYICTELLVLPMSNGATVISCTYVSKLSSYGQDERVPREFAGR